MSKFQPVVFPRMIFRLAVLFAVLGAPGICLASHPYHVSHAEVNWNPNSGNFEVALCVWPSDLEKALAKDQAKTIDLDKVANLDEIMESYIAKSFLIRRVPAKPSSGQETKPAPNHPLTSVRWVGHERDLKSAWLYFEVEGDKQGAQWTIENRVFFELNDDQLNHVETTIGKSTESVICKFGSSRHALETGSETSGVRTHRLRD